MIYMGKRSVDIRVRAKKANNMQLFRVPIFLPLLVLTFWAVPDGVYGTCTVDDNCKNSGKCASSACDCTGTGYGGDNCEDDIDECSASPAPCDGHADCTNTHGSYNCTCKSGYAGDGKTCREGVCSKDGKECLNGGTCETSSTPTTCTCANGYKGATCQNAGGTVTISAYLLSLTVVTFFVIQ